MKTMENNMLEVTFKAGIFALLGAIALGCSSNGTEKSTGSNWLECADDGDCAVVADAMCGQDGYCVDDSGARISRLPDGSGGSSGQGGAGAGGGGGSGEGCEYGGATYAVGDSFPSTDGCNTCSCGDDGNVACTLRACVADGGAGVSTCETLAESRNAELEAIQSCTSDAECGQVLTGTSCGCTRDLVARTDADAATFHDLGEQMTAAGCEQLGSTCDCPAADGFACEAGRCTWNYVDTSECQPVDPAQLCVRGTVAASGETLAAGDPLRVVIMPEGCWSSSCTTADVASCSVAGSGTNLSVEGEFCLGTTGAQACTADCSGGGSAECGNDMTLAEGNYTVTLGSLSVSFTVPSTLDFGGICDGSPF